MSRSAIVRHNAKLIRKHVEGKNKAERNAIYELISGGPLALMAHAAAMLAKAHVDAGKIAIQGYEQAKAENDRHYEEVARSIRRLEMGGRPDRYQGFRN